MQAFKEFVILSAELSHLSENENIKRTTELLTALQNNGFNPVRFEGHYKGSKESSFGIPLNQYYTLIKDNNDLNTLEMLAFDRFNQESILVQYSDGHARLHYRNHIEHIGKLRLVSKEVAEKQDSFTFYPDKGLYYATV